MSYVLIHDGREIERHSTYLACAIAAMERGLAYTARGRTYLSEGVRIERTREEGNG